AINHGPCARLHRWRAISTKGHFWGHGRNTSAFVILQCGVCEITLELFRRRPIRQPTRRRSLSDPAQLFAVRATLETSVRATIQATNRASRKDVPATVVASFWIRKIPPDANAFRPGGSRSRRAMGRAAIRLSAPQSLSWDAPRESAGHTGAEFVATAICPDFVFVSSKRAGSK